MTTSEKFTDYVHHPLRSKGDSFTERFGLFDSSSITWQVNDIKENELLALKTSRSENTIAWDILEMVFNKNSKSLVSDKL